MKRIIIILIIFLLYSFPAYAEEANSMRGESGLNSTNYVKLEDYYNISNFTTEKVDYYSKSDTILKKQNTLSPLKSKSINVDGTEVFIDYIAFYESGWSVVDVNDRIYRDIFSVYDTRYIDFELGLRNNVVGHDLDFKLKYVYYLPDGSVFGEQENNRTIKSGSTSSWFAGGWGYQNPGNWQKGVYKVDIYINDSKVISKNFTIDTYNNYSDYYYFTKGRKTYASNDLIKVEEALYYFNIAIQLNPNDEDYYDWKGGCLFYLKRFEESIEAINMAISINPNNESYYFTKGLDLFVLQKYEQAITEFNTAISINSKEDVFYYMKARCLNEVGKNLDALENYNNAISCNQSNSDYYYWKAKTLYHLKRYNEALEAINKSLSINDQVEDAMKLKSELTYSINLYENGDLDKSGIIDTNDLSFLSNYYINTNFEQVLDQNRDGIIDIYDLVKQAQKIK